MDIKKVQKATLVFTIWTFFYLLWFRWFMLFNWKFNIFSSSDWKATFDEWWYHGWVIQGSYFWIFIISLFLFIPIYILGLCFFLSRNYTKYYEKAFWDSIYKRKTKQIQKNNRKIHVKKRKTHLEVRPRALAGTPQMVAPVQATSSNDMMTSIPSDAGSLFLEEKAPAPLRNTSFSSREIPDNFEGESPFVTPDISSEVLLEDQPVELKEDLLAIMKNAGAQVILNPQIGENTIDYLAVTKDTIFLILKDEERGDWLADEERFNDEDPLWFSETSHRISPITTLKNFEKELEEKLMSAGLSAQIQIILVKTNGNIINAEDMQEIWAQMNVSVARSAFGQPEDLPSFSEAFPKQLETADAEYVEKIKQIIQNI